ncbi:T9SS type A sorting domain-containing protein [Hymenobacter sp. BT683]|uniref:T9SS type A sorting domain-containing protein n=1 Tax=Hymenobacter jeongseonensis TaxID=2791027 RepID=A0ABS0IKT3_9BACT|nr:MBG domain-containing protein [Hymenobacter jeongseonensis]MBF9238478.1 T9SS type A sorting domain-containing protein [Hymenobacter jeongseonensis]
MANLTPTYDGTAKSATATTTPANLSTVSFTYAGSATAPTNAGTYAVVATLNNANYSGSASGSLVIGRAAQTITWATPAAITYGNALTATQLSAMAPGALTYSPTLGVVLDAGTQTLRVNAAETTNYLAATKEVSLNVNQADATVSVTVGGPYTYTGSAQGVSSATVTGLGGASLGNATVVYKKGTNEVSPVEAGTYDVYASFAGSTNYKPASDNTKQLIIAKAPAIIVLSNLSHIYNNTSQGATATVTPAVSGLNLTYTGTANDNTAYGPSNTAPIKAGTYTVAATLANDNYQATPVSGTLTIGRADQSITFDALATKTFGDADFTVSATSSASLPVSFSASGNATVTGNTVHITGAGSATITAAAAADGNYNAATAVSQSLAIRKAPAAVTLNFNAPYTYSGFAQPITGSVTGVGGASLGNPVVTYKAASASEYSTVEPVSAGTYGVKGFYAETENYLAAEAVSNMTIDQAAATITLSNLAHTYNGSAKTATITTSPEGLTVTVTYDGSAMAPVNAGSYQVLASLNNGNYSASDATGTLSIAKASNSIAFDNPGTKTFGDAPFALSASATSGLDVSFAVASGPATIEGSMLTITGAGLVTVTASQAESANYEAAANEHQTFEVSKATATVTLANLSHTYNGVAKAATASTDATGASTFTYEYSKDGNTVEAEDVKDAGTYAVIATLHNDNFTGSASSNLVIAQAPNAISFAPLADKTFGNAPFTLSATATSGLGVSFAVVSGPAIISGSTLTITGAGSVKVRASQAGNANYVVAADVDQTFTVNKATPVIVVEVGGPYTYDGSAQAVASAIVTGVGAADLGAAMVVYKQDNSPTTPVNAGTYDVFASFAGNDNYHLASDNSSKLIIGQRPITLTADAQTKVYGTTTDPALTYQVTSGTLVSGDVFTGALTRTSGESVGDYAIGSTLANTNYTISYVGADLRITARPITLTADAQSKTYGEADPTLTYKVTAGSLAYSDSFTGSLSRVAGNAVGAYAIEQGSVALSTNYDLSYVGAKLSITARPLVIAATGVDKGYDGNVTATVSLSDNRVSGDVLTTSYETASFDNKNVGQNKPVSVSGIAITGADAGNYSANATASASANITAKAITGSFTASNKPYDGTTSASITSRSLSGTVSADDVTLTDGAAAFTAASAGTNKPVTGSQFALSGADAPNYTLTSVDATTADITAVELTPHITAADKVYDGTTTATLSSQTVTGMVNGETAVTLVVGAQSFNNANAGPRTVTASNLSLGGNAASNYSLAANATATDEATISRLGITGSFAVAPTRVYDGTTDAAVSGRSLTGALANDAVSLDGGTASYDTKNVGTGKTVTLTGFTLAGDDAPNYDLLSVETTTANITARDIAGSFAAASKVYDGNRAAEVLTRTVTPLTGDAVTLEGGTATFSDKNVADGKTVTLTGASLGGAQAGNYSLTGVATTTANITAKALEITISADNKVYDGNSTATVTALIAPGTTTSGLVSGDQVEVSASNGLFQNKNVGTGKPVTADVAISNSAAATNADAGNYSANTSATTTAAITARELTITADAQSKTYGDADPALTYKVTTGSLVDGETFIGSLVRATGEDAGTYAITNSRTTGAVTAGSNYTLSYVGANFVIGKATAAVSLNGLLCQTENGVNKAVTATTNATGVSTFAYTYSKGGALLSTTGVTEAGTYVVTATLNNPNFIGSATGNLVINAVPVINSIKGDLTPLSIAAPKATLTATLTDTNLASAVWNWDDGKTDLVSNTSTTLLGTHTYALPGVYKVSLTVTDACGATATLPYEYVVVYDPNGGFVTGGGWITSPVVLTTQYMQVGGKANFGFVAKYKKGSTVQVDGDTEFQFQAGSLNFKSTSLTDMRLVISGDRASYKGVGTINGTGSYGFMVAAIDGQYNKGTGPDRFRMKIWEAASGTVVYDNQAGADENAPASTAIGGGSIVIHAPTKGSTANLVVTDADATIAPKSAESNLLEVYPNPIAEQATIHFRTQQGGKAQLYLYNQVGALVATLYNAEVEGGRDYHLPLSRENLADGVYFCRMITNGKVENKRLTIMR